LGGETYQVPVEVPQERQVSLAMRWIVNFAKNRRGTMVDNLATEIKDAALGQGNAIKKRDDTHKMAQANRAFAHFRW
jgi:small subunit ribosomal protein S7